MKLFHVKSEAPHYALVQWKPTIEVPPRKNTIGVGAPLLRLEAREQEIELHYVWCFSTGHYDVYETELMRRVGRDEFDDAFFEEVAELFSAAGSKEVRALYQSNGVFARES